MSEVKLMRNGVYAFEDEEDSAICVVKDGKFKGAGLGSDTVIPWSELPGLSWRPASQVIWTEDTLVLPEEYLT